MIVQRTGKVYKRKRKEIISRIELLPGGVHYYKANLHCHTTLSDGRLTPEQVKEIYRQKGYQIIAFIDHRIYANHKELNDESFGNCRYGDGYQ